MTLTFDSVGAIQQIGFPGPARVRQVRAFTRLRDCEPEESVEVARSDSQLSFQRRWISKSTGNSVLVTDRFSLGSGSVRWEVEVLDSRGPAVYHNCGEIMSLVSSYKKLGARVVEPFSPFLLGDADLAKVVNIVRGDYVIIGGVDQVNVLQKGTLEQVRQATIETMETGKRNGPFIIQSADFLEYNTPIENVKEFVTTAMANVMY